MTIVITLPDFFEGEAEAIVRLFEERRIDRLHLRKPHAKEAEVENLIREIPPRFYPLISIHDFYSLAEKYSLGGIHLTGRNPIAPLDWKGLISTSCHSIEELNKRKGENFSYLTLSPIFNSISKSGYNAAFTMEKLQMAVREGIIDEKVLALGGVTFEKIQEVENIGFGGGMILGDAWKNHKKQ